MMFAPIIDVALTIGDRRKKLRRAAPLLFIAYGWSVLCAVPVIRDWTPGIKGLGSCSFVSLLGIYVAVRIYKEFNLGRFVTARNALLVVPPCILAMLVGFWWYWWIPSFVVSCFAFELFRRLRIPGKAERMVLYLAATSFSIYLMHITAGGLKVMSRFEVLMHEKYGLGCWMACLASAVAIYFICMAIDLTRRVVLNALKKVWDCR